MPDALRPVREHRARQQLARRRPDRAQARRLRGHRVGLRLGHGDGEVLRHRLPRRRPPPERGRARRDRARDQAPRRDRGRPARSTAEQGIKAIEIGIGEPPPPPRDRQRVRGPVRRRGQPPPRRHRRGGAARPRLALEAGAFAAEINEGFENGGPGAAALAEAVVEACEQPNSFEHLYDDDDADQSTRSRPSPSASTRPRTCSSTRPPSSEIAQFETRRPCRTSRSAWRRRTCRCRPTRRC